MMGGREGGSLGLFVGRGEDVFITVDGRVLGYR